MDEDKITHASILPFTTTQLDYLLICDNDYCAAKILKLFEAWSKNRNHSESIWMYNSIPNIQRALLYEHGEKSVARSLRLLKDKGFILTRQNPTYIWDKTTQYQLQGDAVQAAIATITAENLDEFFDDNPTEPETKIHSAYVYLIQAVGTNYYKIGISTNPQARLKALQAQSPHKLVLIACQMNYDAWRFEQSLHSRFSSCRTQGEWFHLSAVEAEAITELLSGNASNIA